MKATILLIAVAAGSVASAADPAHLVRLYEEEILAHDLYVALGKKYPDIRPLQNIPQSEARHREVMEGILKAEGVTAPKRPEGRRFATKGLDRLYREWLKEGRKSEVDTCRVGVRLEDHDIADLRKAQADFPEHKEALGALEVASNNHLRAFHRNLTSRGGSYKAEALPEADFKTIIAGSMDPGACGAGCQKDCDEPCGRGGRGRGPGNHGCGKSGARGAGGQGAANDEAGRGRGRGNGNGKGFQNRQQGQGRRARR